MFLSLERRFFAKVRMTDGCWVWTGATAAGYGRIREEGHAGRILGAHRVAYEPLVGKTPSVNKPGGNNGMGLRDECDYGHRFDAKNTYYRPDGARRCRACNRDTQHRRKTRLLDRMIAVHHVKEAV